ncbi:hypothetical protein SAMN02910406_02019 [Ruminococcus albus]|uniref:Uncharacterized protein n=2 Tax=Ruminococcus albus TaxID=1264 RepID=A0A1I1KIE1_RUMAL|nr:hypothetical protein SAMN02910406_02019 [Ruminococcus albus]
MIAIHFGHLCFNKPSGEQSILMVLASKNDHSSMDDFVSKALIYLETHEDFCDNWSDMYKNRIYTPIDDEEKKWMRSRLAEMSQRISIAYDPIINAVYIIPPEWNDITIGVETESEYIFYQWTTSA